MNNMQDKTEERSNSQRFPMWLKRPIHSPGKQKEVVTLLKDGQLHTVCEEAKCPNRAECYAQGTATFLILGTVCTRDCRFCGVHQGETSPLDLQEAVRVANAAEKMNLSHIVITSVTRDDIPDGGASIFAAAVNEIHTRLPSSTVEVLTPDFGGNLDALQLVLDSKPDVFNHNVETVPRLYQQVRPMANFEQSLTVLRYASEMQAPQVKSGIMVGLGETESEVIEVMKQLRAVGCTIMTIGQYLRPSKEQLEVKEYVTPEQFKKYEQIGIELGFFRVWSGPFVRSSYKAGEILSPEF